MKNDRKFFTVTFFDVLILSVLICEGTILWYKIFQLAKDRHYVTAHRYQQGYRRVQLDKSNPEFADD